MIAKGSVRVLENYLIMNRNWSGEHGRESHVHAECVINRGLPDESQVKFGKAASFEDLSTEDQGCLRDEIIDSNRSTEKDQNWKKQLTCPVAFCYIRNGSIPERYFF
jgi:hypothetical protein